MATKSSNVIRMNNLYNLMFTYLTYAHRNVSITLYHNNGVGSVKFDNNAVAFKRFIDNHGFTFDQMVDFAFKIYHHHFTRDVGGIVHKLTKPEQTELRALLHTWYDEIKVPKVDPFKL